MKSLHMRGNTPWDFQNSTRRGLPNGQAYVVPGQSFGRVQRQSPRGQKLLDRGAQRVNTRSSAPAFSGRVPATSAEASALVKAGIPYFDGNTTVPFVARFGGASESFLDLSLKGLQLSPKAQERLKTIAALIPPLLWYIANLKTLQAYDEALQQVQSLWLFDAPLSMHLMPLLNFIVPAVVLPSVFKQERSSNQPVLGLLALGAVVALGLSKEWPIVAEMAFFCQGILSTWIVFEISHMVLGVDLDKK